MLSQVAARRKTIQKGVDFFWKCISAVTSCYFILIEPCPCVMGYYRIRFRSYDHPAFYRLRPRNLRAEGFDTPCIPQSAGVAPVAVTRLAFATHESGEREMALGNETTGDDGGFFYRSHQRRDDAFGVDGPVLPQFRTVARSDNRPQFPFAFLQVIPSLTIPAPRQAISLVSGSALPARQGVSAAGFSHSVRRHMAFQTRQLALHPDKLGTFAVAVADAAFAIARRASCDRMHVAANLSRNFGRSTTAAAFARHLTRVLFEPIANDEANVIVAGLCDDSVKEVLGDHGYFPSTMAGSSDCGSPLSGTK